jgi:hypothetical protein
VVHDRRGASTISRWIPRFLHTLRLAEESDPVRVGSVTGGRPMAHVRPRHFWHVGLGVQGLRGIPGHWQDEQRSTVFEVCQLRSAPGLAPCRKVAHRATSRAAVASRGQRNEKGAPGEGREAAAATASGVPYRAPRREPSAWRAGGGGRGTFQGERAVPGGVARSVGRVIGDRVSQESRAVAREGTSRHPHRRKKNGSGIANSSA